MLTLPIKKKWFDMILSGEKKEEYRAITPYWTKRFQSIVLVDNYGLPLIRECRIIKLRAGYSKNAPEAKVAVSIKKGTGRPEWEAEHGIEYWVLKIEKILKVKHSERNGSEKNKLTREEFMRTCSREDLAKTIVNIAFSEDINSVRWKTGTNDYCSSRSLHPYKDAVKIVADEWLQEEYDDTDNAKQRI